jgi:hypothetical protein
MTDLLKIAGDALHRITFGNLLIIATAISLQHSGGVIVSR